MNREKSFIRSLITHTMILLLPLIVLGFLVIFLYLGRLENKFQELNGRTMETSVMRMDELMQECLKIYYQMSLDDNVHNFLVQEFKSHNERISLLVNIRTKLEESLMGRDGIAHVALYSKINDEVIGDSAVYDRKIYYEEMFYQKSPYGYDEFWNIIENVRTTPIWLETTNYLIYCSDIKLSGRDDRGKYFVAVEKQKISEILSETGGKLEFGYAVSYQDQKIIMQTEDFDEDAYKAEINSGDMVYHYKNDLVNRFSSKKVGGITYVYTMDYEEFGGNVAQMVRSLVGIVSLMLIISVILARKKMKHIRKMYINVLEENDSLESHLNDQVENLNRQMLLNALRGYNRLPMEKHQLYCKYKKIQVLIFRFAAGQELDSDLLEGNSIKEIVHNCLETDWSEYWYLQEKEETHICVISYKAQENPQQLISNLQKMLPHHLGIGVHMGLSAQIEDITKLSEAYEQAGAALYYCTTMHEDGGVVCYEDIMELEKEKIYYPPEKEKQLIRSIKMGMSKETDDCLKHIYQMNFVERHLSKGAMRQLFIRMLNTIYDLIDMVYGTENTKYEDLGRVCRNILQESNVQYSFEVIESIAQSICQKCSVRKGADFKERIVDYIRENFKNQDLSLERMAADFEMSYYHLSRLFNECMQMNFASYLTGVRLEHSRQLLETTSCSVEQVALQAGFLQAGTFIRAFKKYYGVTPGKYREERQV